MTDKLTIPVYESPETISIETVLEHYCKKAKSDIRRYGVEKALERWHVVCDYMQTMSWWPAVAEKVEDLFDEAFEERNRRQQAEREQELKSSKINLSINQTQSNKDRKTEATMQSGSSGQIFTGDVDGQFTTPKS